MGVLAHDRDMADHVDGRDVCGQDDDALAALLDGLDDVLDSSPEGLLAVEVAGEFEYLSPEGVVGEGVGNGGVVESLGLLLFHVDIINVNGLFYISI